MAKSELANAFTPVPVTNSQARQQLSDIAVTTSFMVYCFVLLLLSMSQMRNSEKSRVRLKMIKLVGSSRFSYSIKRGHTSLLHPVTVSTHFDLSTTTHQRIPIRELKQRRRRRQTTKTTINRFSNNGIPSLRASSPGRSGGGAGKGRRTCYYVSWNFEFHLQFPSGSPSTELSDFHQ